jgi:hypothetical protein
MDELKIAVVIPWRPQPRRMLAYEYVTAWYKKYLPSAEIIACDSDTEDWNGSRARNIGVKKAQEYGADIVIMNDADTVPSVLPLAKSITAALSDGLMHNPYTDYNMISYEDSMTFFNGEGPTDPRFLPSFIFPETWWGVVVFKPEVWWILGGMDERFHGWGYEDTAMAYTHAIVFDKNFVKHDGQMFSFEHEPAGQPNHRNHDNLDYYRNEYLSRRTPEELLDYVKGNVVKTL